MSTAGRLLNADKIAACLSEEVAKRSDAGEELILSPSLKALSKQCERSTSGKRLPDSANATHIL
jgi:hypothetical protein